MVHNRPTLNALTRIITSNKKYVMSNSRVCLMQLFIFTTRRVCIARTMLWQDVRLSVCLSVTRGIVPKRLHISSRFFSPSDSPTILVMTHSRPTCRHVSMKYIVASCPLTKLNGSLSRLHSADEDAVSWLTSYG